MFDDGFERAISFLRVEANSCVIRDFYKVVDAFGSIFCGYKFDYTVYDTRNFEFCVDLIVKGWNSDVFDLINRFKNMSYKAGLGDVAVIEENLIVVPSLVL